MDGDPVLNIEVVSHKPLMGYRGDQTMPFIKITLTDPKSVPPVRGQFDGGYCAFEDLFSGPYPTYESNIVFVLRFMIDTKVVGMNWIEVPAGKYTIASEKRSSCQLEVSFRLVKAFS